MLRPGGRAIMSFSNRCFASKAIAKWLASDDVGRMTIVANYFHFSGPSGPSGGPGWDEIVALDLSPPRPPFPANPFADVAAVMRAVGPRGDPMFVVQARKAAS